MKVIERQQTEISSLKRQLLRQKLSKNKTFQKFKSKEFSILFGMQNHKERQPWKKEEKRLAISIFLRSPSTYRYFRKIMILPGESTIRMWLSSKKCHSTGFNKNLFEKIKIKVDTMSDMEKDCVLMFDDMSIKQCLE